MTGHLHHRLGHDPMEKYGANAWSSSIGVTSTSAISYASWIYSLAGVVLTIFGS
jgi:hypothetical protein